MAVDAGLSKRIESGCPVFYFYSAEGYLVRQRMAAVRGQLLQGEAETTVLDGPAPGIEQVIMAAGTISFFGTRRIVEMPELAPAGYSDKDLDALCDALQSAENAVFLLGSVFEQERGRLRLSKRAQKLIALCKKIGVAQELAQPKPFELKAMMIERARLQGAVLTENAASALMDRCGNDPFRLENETDKLCALAGYGTVTPAMVAQMCAQDLEADVFEMVRLVTAKNSTGACQKLAALLRLQNDPIQITGALIGSYVDLYRVRLGQLAKRGYSAVFQDFGYKGSDYRLKRSAETAAHYTLPQLEGCLDILAELDKGLKSSPVDKQTLLETALCRLALAGSIKRRAELG